MFVRLALTTALPAACGIFEPPLPDTAVRFSPPQVFGVWWSMTEACSGYSRSLAAVEWYVVPGAYEISFEGRRVNAYWTSAGNRIVLAGEPFLDGALVRHEMLHSLTRDGGHSRKNFLARCGGVAACAQDCIRDAGPAPLPPVGVPRVTPESLAIRVQVSPSEPNSTLLDGNFMLTVFAHNPRDHAVVLLLPLSGDAGPSASFSWIVEGEGGWHRYDDRAEDPGITYFSAGETKRQVFDFRVAPNNAVLSLTPGSYRARGAYGSRFSDATSFVIAR